LITNFSTTLLTVTVADNNITVTITLPKCDTVMIKVLQGSVVTQTMLGGLTVQHLVNFL